MKNLTFDPHTPVAPGIADITIAMVASGGKIAVTVNQLSPLAKGRAIQAQKDIRYCTIKALEGDVHFDPVRPDHATYMDRLERFICWHPFENVRKAAVEPLPINDLGSLASDLLKLRCFRPDFTDACLSLDLHKARQLGCDGDWPSVALQSVEDVLKDFVVIHRAFHVQKIAAWAWRMIHVPFDNMLGEANYREAGYATVAVCLEYLRQRRDELRTTLSLYNSRSNNVDRRKFKFLKRYGLEALLKPDNERALLAAFGPTRIAQLKQELDELQRKDLQVQLILGEIEGAGEAPIPFVNYRMKRVDALLCPVSVITILAMRCANLAELTEHCDLDIAEPPAWLFDGDVLEDDTASRYRQFLQIFLFYRGAFVEDKLPQAPKNLLASNVVAHDALADLACSLNGDRTCRQIVEDMRNCAARGEFGSGPSSPAPVTDFALRTYWREAA